MKNPVHDRQEGERRSGVRISWRVPIQLHYKDRGSAKIAAAARERWAKVRAQAAATYHLDLKTQQISKLPDSDGMFATRLSRDGRYLTAIPGDRNTVMLYDLQTERWSELVKGYGSIAWSHDSKSVYLIRRRQALASELVRISVPDGKTERVLDLKDVTLGGLWPGWVSLLPDGSPLLMLDKSTQEIYRLDLQYR